MGPIAKIFPCAMFHWMISPRSTIISAIAGAQMAGGDATDGYRIGCKAVSGRVAGGRVRSRFGGVSRFLILPVRWDEKVDPDRSQR